jgi:hypothetical protein
MIMPIAEIQLPAVLFQLKGIDFETLPWWIPGALVVVGIAFYEIPQCDRVIPGQLPEWRVLPRWVRIPFTGLFFGGAGVIVFATLQQYNWMYVLFLFGYARAVEGATILHFFGRITNGVEALKRAISRSGSTSTSTSTSPSPSRWSVAWVVSLIPFVSVGADWTRATVDSQTDCETTSDCYHDTHSVRACSRTHCCHAHWLSSRSGHG